MRLSLHVRPDGAGPGEVARIVYSPGDNVASFGVVPVAGPAVVWELGGDGVGALLSSELELDASAAWIVRCDRIDFPPGGIAYLHTHPGPGIRYLLHGEIEIRTKGTSERYRPGQAWFEAGPDPVLALASGEEETAFVRVLVLPAEWAGKRTIRYVDPADEDRPKLQRPTVFLEQPLELA